MIKCKSNILVLGLTLVLTFCGSTSAEAKAQKSVDRGGLTGSPSAVTETRNEAAGAKYYLGRKKFLSPTKTRPASKKLIHPDSGGHGVSSVLTRLQSSKRDAVESRSLKEQAVSITGGCKIFVSGSNLGSSIQSPDLSYIGDDLQRPEFSNIRPLANEIFSVYGNPETNLGKLRVLRDWIARMAIHPHPPFHADADKNTHVLPDGWDWSMFDAISEGGERWWRDSAFWSGYRLNGYNMLNRLFNLDGTEPHPMLKKIGPAEYRIKKLTEDVNDPEVYRTVLCSYQAEMLIALAASIGIHGILVSTAGHDTAAFYLPEFSKWVYMDPTYNEDYIWATTENEVPPPERPVGSPVSPAELYWASEIGVMREVFFAAKIEGPSWEPTVYVDSVDDIRATYLGDGSSYGWIVMGSNLIQEYADPFRTNQIMYDAPHFYKYPDDPATVALSNRRRVSDMEIVFPTLGVSISGTTPLDALSVSVSLASNWPYHDHFEISDEDGTWRPLIGDLVLTVSAGEAAQVDSVDKNGRSSTIASMSAKCKGRDHTPAVNLLLLN